MMNLHIFCFRVQRYAFFVNGQKIMHKLCYFVRKINVILNKVKDLNTSTLCLQILRFAQNDKIIPISGFQISVILIFHQLAITYTLRLFIAQALHLVFFVFRV